jgi:thiamine biosynthesis lipoprotein
MFSQSQFLLDTVIDITVVSRSQKKAMTAIDAAYAEIERIEALLSKYKPESQISSVNQHAGAEQAVTVDVEVVDIVQRSLIYTERTHGMFNMALGAVIDLWDIGSDHERVPEQAELQQALNLIDPRYVEIGEQNLRLGKTGMSLDLGGIAKGYSIDQALQLLQQHGIQHALINAGGDIRCLGAKPDGSPWRIGIQHPRENRILGVVELRDAAITTSGDYERFFVRDDASTHEEVRYHHLFDPQSGMPARGCQSVTILTNTAEAADVYSTAVFIMGPEQGLAFIEGHPELEGMIVQADGEILTSSGFTYTPVQ